jgi:CheY-like chemotaxis protein
MKILKDLKILLVDDNRVNQRIALLIFGQMQLKCDIASDGKEAFEMVQQKEYDLIFMDMQMPVMDGLESTKLIRAFEKDSETLHQSIIVALTGSELAENKDVCLEIGMNDFIEKPIRIESIQKYISILIK